MRRNADVMFNKLPKWFKEIVITEESEKYDYGVIVISGRIKKYNLKFRCQGNIDEGWYSVEVKDDNAITNVEVDIAKIINDKNRCIKIIEKVVEIKNILEGGKE